MSSYAPDLIIVRAAAEQALMLSDEDYFLRLVEQVLERRATAGERFLASLKRPTSAARAK